MNCYVMRGGLERQGSARDRQARLNHTEPAVDCCGTLRSELVSSDLEAS